MSFSTRQEFWVVIVPLLDEDPKTDVSGRDPKEFVCRMTIGDLLKRVQEGKVYEGRQIRFCRRRSKAIRCAEKFVVGKEISGNY